MGVILLLLTLNMIPNVYEASRTLAFVPENRNLDSDHLLDGNFTDVECGDKLYGYLGGTRSNFVAEVFHEITTRQSFSLNGIDSRSVKHAIQNLEMSFVMRGGPIMRVRIRHSNSNVVEQIAVCCVSVASRLAREMNKRRNEISSLQIKEMVNRQRTVVDKINSEMKNGKLNEKLTKKLVENQELLNSLQKQLEWVKNSTNNGVIVSEVVPDRVHSHYIGRLWLWELWGK